MCAGRCECGRQKPKSKYPRAPYGEGSRSPNPSICTKYQPSAVRGVRFQPLPRCPRPARAPGRLLLLLLLGGRGRRPGQLVLAHGIIDWNPHTSETPSVLGAGEEPHQRCSGVAPAAAAGRLGSPLCPCCSLSHHPLGMSWSESENTPLRADRSQGASPTDEILRRGAEGDRKWPWVLFGLFAGIMLTVLESGDASTCSPGLAVIMGFLPGTLAGSAATQFYNAGNANAMLMSARKRAHQVGERLGLTPDAAGAAESAQRAET